MALKIQKFTFIGAILLSNQMAFAQTETSEEQTETSEEQTEISEEIVNEEIVNEEVVNETSDEVINEDEVVNEDDFFDELWLEGDWSEGSSETLERIQEGPISDAPSRVDVIHTERIEDAANLADVMEWLPGGSIYQAGSTNAAIIIDGLPASHVTLLMDGIPFSRLINNREGPSIDMRSIGLDASELRRVEVHRGVGPAGSGRAGGAVINLITADPPEQVGAYGRITGNYDFNSVYRRNIAGLLTAPFTDELSGSISASYSESDALDINNDHRYDTPDSALIHGLLRTRWAPNPNEGLSLMAMIDENQTDNLGFESADSHDRVSTDTTSAFLSGRWWLTDDHSLRLDHVTSLSSFGHKFANVGENGSEILVADTNQQRVRQSLILSSWYENHDVSSELVADGLRVWRYAAQEAEETEENFDPLLDGEPLDQLIFGIGTNHGWQPTDDLTHETRIYLEEDDAFGFGWSGQTAVSFQLSDNFTLRTGASQTRRTPLAEERFYTFSHASVGYEIVGNTALIPESLWSARFGGAWMNRNETIGLELESYYHRISDHISFVSLDSDGSTTRITYSNAPEVRIAGANSSVEFSALPGGLLFRVSYAWQPINEKLEDDGFPLVYRAEHSVRTELRGRWLENRLESWFDLRGQSEMDVINSSGLVEMNGAPGFVVLGAGTSFDLTHDVELRLRVDNILDQTNALWGPKPGRRLLFTLKFQGGDGSGR